MWLQSSPRDGVVVGPIEVLVIAGSGERVCATCANGRTWEEVTGSLHRQLRRSFGEAVTCRFVDLADAAREGLDHLKLSAYPGRLRTPVVVIDGRVAFRGLFSPTFIRREVRVRLEERESRARRRAVGRSFR